MGTSNQTEKVIKNTKKSAISNHLFLYVDILFSDFNNNKLLIKETLLIKCDQPVLNRKKKSFPLDVSDDSLSLFFLENHCIKYVRVRSFLVRIFPHSDWIRTRITLNMDTSCSEYNQFSIFNRKNNLWTYRMNRSFNMLQYKLSECFCCKRASYKILSYIWLNVYLQKQLPEVFCFPRNFAKFTGKHLCQSLFFNKVAKNKFLRTPFLQNTFRRCFYRVYWKNH